MSMNPRRLFTALAVLCLSALTLDAQTILKVASLAPESSPYGDVLNKIASEWAKVTNRQVTIRAFHGGIAGSEEDVIRKLKIGQLQGAVLTSAGLSRLDKSLITVSAPLLIGSNEELKYVMDKLKPEFDSRLQKQGYIAIVYSRAGWTRMFSKQPFMMPADIRARKLAINDTDREIFAAFQTMGYKPIGVDMTQFITSLNSGLIDSIFTSPVAAGSFQWFGIAKNMLDLPIAPFIGALIIEEKSWNRIPAETRAQLIEVAGKTVTSQMDAAIDNLDDFAITSMKKYGLNVITPTDAAKEAWRAEFERGVSLTLGTAFDKSLYDKIKALVQEYRK